MVEKIVSHLETARGQIEGKFSEAGTFLQDALKLIDQQLQVLNNLLGALDPEAIKSATEDLLATAQSLYDLPGILDARAERIRVLRRQEQALRPQVTEIFGLLRYLRTFAFNVKITAAGMGADSDQFSSFSQEMSSRIDHGDKQIRAFVTDLDQLASRFDASLKSEAELYRLVEGMLPQVPQCLSHDANAMRAYNERISETTRSITAMAKEVQMSVLTALSTLQIGDSVRQRIEHVQDGLSALQELLTRLEQDGVPLELRQRLASHVKAMLTAQLADTAETFDAEAARMLDLMARIADSANKLVIAFDLEHGEDNSLRGLEQSIAQAHFVVESMDKAAERARDVQCATEKGVKDLLERVGGVREVKDEVQYMALNTSLRCVHIGEIGRPLQVVANELSTYAKLLDAAAVSTLKGVEHLASSASASSTGELAAGGAHKLQSAAQRLRVAADVVEIDLKQAISKGQDLVRKLSTASEKLNFKEELVDIVYQSASLLGQESQMEADIDDISGPLAEIMSKIGRTYTMARERQLHAQFSPGGEEAIEEAPSNTEDEFEMFG
jgi:hypothetical protein